MKNFLNIFVALLISFSLVACSTSNDSDSNDSDVDTELSELEAILEASKEERAEITSQIESVLSDKSVTSVDVLTLTEGGFSADVQLQGDILKADVNKDEALALCEELVARIEELDVVDEISINLIDSKYQLIVRYYSDETYEFFE